MTTNEMIKQLMVTNYQLLSRQSLLSANQPDSRGRNFNKEFGYPIGELGPRDYWELYESVGIANRVVSVYPEECWSVYPEIYEEETDDLTEFERAWEELNQHGEMWSYLDRIDHLSGIGYYGVLYLGFSDNKDPSKPLPGVGDDGNPDPKVPKPENKLIYLKAFENSSVSIHSYETDNGNPRYGQPTMYNFVITNPTGQYVQDTDAPAQATTQNTSVSIKVHWSRCIHVADNRKSSEVYGMPRMKPVIPEIFDIRKVRGGSAEMMWQGALPGISFETHPDLGLEVDLDKESVREEFEKYMNGLQRFMALTGVTAKSMAPQVASPADHLEEQYRSIAACLGMPMRVLLGTESGHLASSQDVTTWNRRLGKRQNMYVTPFVIRPFIQRLIMAGVLPQPRRFLVSWNDLNSLSAEEKAKIALTRTQCLQTYATGQVEKMMPLLEYYISILGLSVAEAVAIVKKTFKKNRKMATVDPNAADPLTNPNAAGAQDPGKIKLQGGTRQNGDDQNDPGHPGVNDKGKPRLKP